MGPTPDSGVSAPELPRKARIPLLPNSTSRYGDPETVYFLSLDCSHELEIARVENQGGSLKFRAKIGQSLRGQGHLR
jgi:hypothetical protein